MRPISLNGLLEKLRNRLPPLEELKANRAFTPVHHLLHDPELWHLSRRSVATAAFIGTFISFIPIPTQMLAAAIVAIVIRANLPLSVALVWLSNPITFAPMYYFSYKVGATILGVELDLSTDAFTFDWILGQLDQIWLPFLSGTLLTAWCAAITAKVIAQNVWRLHVIERWKSRRQRRQHEQVRTNSETTVTNHQQ